jgi:hypothetical protein
MCQFSLESTCRSLVGEIFLSRLTTWFDRRSTNPILSQDTEFWFILKLLSKPIFHTEVPINII